MVAADGDAGGDGTLDDGPLGETAVDGALEAFELLTHETRLAIMTALVEALRADPTDPVLSYSDLRRAADVPDSGNFNYHLGLLEGVFVRKTGAGYRISDRGHAVVGQLVGGRYDADAARGPVPAAGACPACDRQLRARYEDGTVTFACDNDHTIRHGLEPRALAQHPLAECAGFVALRASQTLETTRENVCPTCRSPVETGVESTDATGWDYRYVARCGRCGMSVRAPVSDYATIHPGVVGFCHDHGVDVRRRPFWELPFVTDAPVSRSGTDPLRLRVDYEIDGDKLPVRVDADGDISPDPLPE